jgi:phosphoglycerate kinase
VVSPQDVTAWCAQLIEPAPDFPEFEQCLAAIPGLDGLADLPAGTRVLVRADVDVAVKNGVVTEDVRLRSLLETIRFGAQRSWIQILYGHLGRDKEATLEPVVTHLHGLLQEIKVLRVAFVREWMNDATGEILESAGREVAAMPHGAVVVLENTRRYSLEQALWKARIGDLSKLADRLTRYANGMRERFASVHVNEGFAASNRDLSSTLVPLTMDHIALGRYIEGELRRHVTRTRQAELVIFSGIKINKLDDLEQILRRGRVRMVIAAGSLAMALLKADDPDFELGLAGRPEGGKIYIPPERVEQARRMLQLGRSNGVEFVLPVDFVLGDGGAVDRIPPDQAQFDVGPKTIELHARKVGEFIDSSRKKAAAGQGPAVAFHNGVFGKFEEERFATGTRRFMEQLKRMHEAGVEVYVGGGEGGAALEQYGDESWVTHSFTAGGTILKALGNEPIPYLKALYLKTQR